MNGQRISSLVRQALIVLLALEPAVALAVIPLIAGLGKQIVQNMLMGQVKDHMMASLAGAGCKGAAVTGLVANLQTPLIRDGGGLVPGGGMGGMGGGFGPAAGPGAPADRAGTAPLQGKSRRAYRGAPEIPTLPPGVSPNQIDMSQAMALVQQQAATLAPGMPQMSPEQMAQAQAAMSQMQSAMSQPLTREETLGVFDELSALGVLTPAMRTEAQDCIRLAPPSATQSVGQTGAIFKSLVLPQLHQMHERLQDLPPDQQQQLADEVIDALHSAPAQDRKAFLDGFGMGFFPAPVVDRVRSGLR
jgi:hypothetical protein